MSLLFERTCEIDLFQKFLFLDKLDVVAPTSSLVAYSVWGALRGE